MYKWIIKTALALSFTSASVLTLYTPVAAAAVATSRIEASSIQEGTVTIHYNISSSAKRHKVMIVKNEVMYTYNLDAKRQSETFPLQSGSGTYEITLLENTSGTTYRKLDTTSVELLASSADQVFLASVQNVNWQESKRATALAAKLIAGKQTDQDKAQAIHQYVTSNIVYTDKEVGTVYLPSVDDTLTSRAGMCYDYASLMAVMLRSSGIPTKLVMGDTTYVTEYHAWNEIYLNGKWVIVDATVDAAYTQAGKPIPFAKQANKYTVKKIY